MLKNEKLIPPGTYCYHLLEHTGNGQHSIVKCPYHEMKTDKPPQEQGYCHFLEIGDFECDCLSLLWDGVKECGINISDNELKTSQIADWMEKILELEEDGNRKKSIIKKINELRSQE